MKKSIFKLYSIVLIVLIFASCADLDLPSDGRLPKEDLFSEYYRVKNYYNQCYAYIPVAGFTYGNTPLASFSDEAHDASDGVSGPVNNWYNNRTSATNNPVDGHWESLFEGIFKCNTFLQSVSNPEIATATLDPVERDGWLAEIRVLRAFYYLQLIKRYGGVPIMDVPYEINHDFSQERRATFEECVDFILADCDAALATPESTTPSISFRWNVSDSESATFTRAIAYAIKSQASLYAASPLWYVSGSKYTWEKAAEITKEALDQCLAHGFELFDITPSGGIVQNAYEYYFINPPDASRSVDKETIYTSVARSNVWSLAGLPIIPGVIKAGAGPSQELVDAYGMKASGEMPILGYSDSYHLQPIINHTSGYNPADPYIGRDPRFYASIYFNGATREIYDEAVLDTTIYIGHDPSGNSMEITDNDDDSFTVLCPKEVDPYFYLWWDDEMEEPSVPTLKFEYKSNMDSKTFELFFFKADGSFKETGAGNMLLKQADDWVEFELSLSPYWTDFGWGRTYNDFMRIDPIENYTGAGAIDPNLYDYEITIRNIRFEMFSQASTTTATIATSVGGDCGISSDPTETKHTRTGYYMRKFNNYQSSAQKAADGFMRVFRLGELYLNFAEAAYQAKGPDVKVGNLSAREAVNVVRARAGMPALPAGLSASDFEVRYRNERQVELAFEEHRFFDVRRWKILDKTDGFVTGMRIIKNGDDEYVYERFKLKDRGTNSDKYLMYPIPQSEVIKMENLTGMDWQNPGWR